MAWVVYLYKILQQTKQKMNKKISYISKEIVMKMADYKIYKKLSKDEEIDICSNVLLEISF